MKTTLTIIIVLLTLTSCSVHKRMYSPGYNFMWNTNKHNTPTHYATATNNNQIVETTPNDSIATDDYVASTENKITVTKTEKINLTSVKKIKLNAVKNVVNTTINNKNYTKKQDEKPKRIVSPYLKFGAICSVICIFFSVLFISLYFFEIGGLLLILSVGLIASVCGIFALIAGLLGMIQIAVNPEEYKGNWYLIICFLPLLMLLLAFNLIQ